MRSIVTLCGAGLAALFVSLSAIHAQAPAAAAAPPVFRPLAAFPLEAGGPVLRAPAQMQKPFTVAGPRGVLLGQQDGSLEAWVLPVKLFSHLTLEARIEGYPVPIDVNQQAAEIEVRPDRTIMTYSHIGFTVRQIMFSAPASADEPATGPVILFEFDCLRPTEFTFRFEPNMQWMWPARSEGLPGVDWVSPDARDANAAGGFYVLGVDYPDLAGAVTIPGATPGISSPYQERPHDFPVELKLRIDPARDKGRLYPLLMAVGMNRAAAEPRALGQALARLNAAVPSLYAADADHYRKLLANATSIETPDKELDEAFQWAVISIDQLRTEVGQAATPKELAGQPRETALVAGYLNSADSARPGFGWFFGRDALYTLYAVNGYGDFALTRDELEFLIHRQRADGKIMHEYSQTAAAVDWAQFPYQWAAADATPLFLLAMADYVRASGDVEFLAAHREAVEKAWAFETDPAHDTDHDGIYDNSQGTGWVESWPPTMPHQEVYLALLDQQASAAYAFLEGSLKDAARAKSGEARAAALVKTINAEYYDGSNSCYGFSHDVLRDGSTALDRTRTVYPALAWWSDLPGTATKTGSILEHPEGCLRAFVDSAINTDWGTRDVANDEKLYDGMSYHQGSVWPLFTGWAALAEYRGGQPQAGYQLLKENALLTQAQDLGSHTELLSGDYFVPMGRSTSHQLWSSAMVITPALRGLFGIRVDATTKTITVNPRLPGGWRHAVVRNVPLPDGMRDITFDEKDGKLLVTFAGRKQSDWHFRSDMTGSVSVEATTEKSGNRWRLPSVSIPLPALEVAWGAIESPVPGDRSRHARILREDYEDHKLVFTAEGPGDSTTTLYLVRHRPANASVLAVSSDLPLSDAARNGAVLINGTSTAEVDPLSPEEMELHFPPGAGFHTLTVTLAW